MKPLFNIRNHYKPIQPTAMQSAQNAVYTEMLPAEKLLPFIYCYWTLKTTSQLAENYSYRVISDGCIDIFFPLENPDESYVMGFCKSYTEFDLGKQFNYIGIRFLPTIFPLIFGQNAKELSNTDVRLSLVLSDLSRIISHKINELQSLQEIKNQLDSIFIKHLQKTDFQIDSRFYNALEIILKRQGNILITNDLDTGLSPRHLRRLFEFYIGDTAKTFSQVVRFQSVLTAKKYSQNTDNQLFYDIDYYDQSHFIKEFKTFYGVTPREAFLNN